MRVIVLHTLASKRANEYERAREREITYATHTYNFSESACVSYERVSS